MIEILQRIEREEGDVEVFLEIGDSIWYRQVNYVSCPGLLDMVHTTQGFTPQRLHEEFPECGGLVSEESIKGVALKFYAKPIDLTLVRE